MKYSTILSGAILIFAFTGDIQAASYTMDAIGVVSNDFSATPGNLSVGGSSPNYTYGTGADTLLMSTYNILATGNMFNTTFTLDSLTNSGGDFAFFSFVDPGADLTITAGSAIYIDAIDTRGLSGVSDTYAGGNITIASSGGSVYIASIITCGSNTISKGKGGGIVNISAANNLTVPGAIYTRSVSPVDCSGGNVTISSTTGDIDIDGTITTSGSGGSSGTKSGIVNISAAGGTANVVSITTYTQKGSESITVVGNAVVVDGDLDASSGGSNVAGSDITLTSSNGNMSVTGDIKCYSGQGLGATATIGASGGNVSIIGAVNCYGTKADGGSANISASGTITVDGLINSASKSDPGGSDQDGGPTTFTAGGNISLTAIDTFSIGPDAGEDGGDINITSTNGNVTVSGDINANSISSTDGNLTVSAANGTIELADIDINELNLITLTAQSQGLTITGALSNLTIDQGAQTVQGGLKSGSINVGSLKH